MNFKSPEPIVLAVALFLLAGGALGLALSFPSLSDITGVTSLEPKEKPAPKLNPEDVGAGAAVWNSPDLWKEPETHLRLFDSIRYLFYPSLYPTGNYIQVLTPGGPARSPGGVLLSWYEKYHIEFTSGTVDREDPDGDGFSNITEFKNEQVGERFKAFDLDGSKSTNPLDPKDHPSYLSRLRLQKYEARPFHIQLKGYEQVGGVYVYQIYLQDVPSGQQPGLKKTGDLLGSEGYTVGAFHLNIVNVVDPNTHLAEDVDESTLDLVKPDIDFTITLPYRKLVDSPESTADFVMLMPTEVDKVMKVPRGKILTVPYIPAAEAQYLVIEAGDDGAKIRDTKTKQEYHILKLDPAEWDEVPFPPASAPSKTP
jgi:hypothetical protein